MIVRGGTVVLPGAMPVVADVAGPSFPSGGAFVDLVPVRDGYVTQAVASALDVTERAQQSLEEAIAERLGDGRHLLIFGQL